MKDGIKNLTASLAAIAIGLLFGLVILFISNPSDALKGFGTILMGGFAGGMKGVGDVFYIATPLILTGLSVGFAFKTGLFNIGVTGQFTFGAYCAIFVGLRGAGLPPYLHWGLALLAAFAGGGLWAMLPGILKAFLNVNEVISSIMMNYIAMYFVNMCVRSDPRLFDKLRNQSKIIPASAVIPKWGLNRLFSGSSINAGIFVAVVVAIVIYIVLNKTTFGFELKACGFNKNASRYAGINEKRSIISSMMIAGALAGLGGGLILLAGSGRHIEIVDVLATEGFMGIPVALLGLSNPIGIIFSALFIAYISQGGFYMQLYNFAPEIINIIIASIIYCSALSLTVKKYFERRRLIKSKGADGR